MEVELFKWEDFKIEILQQQIQNRVVGVGFESGGTKITIFGQPDPENKNLWTVYAVFEKNGSKRTMSKKGITDVDIQKELEQNVRTARSILSSSFPS